MLPLRHSLYIRACPDIKTAFGRNTLRNILRFFYSFYIDVYKYGEAVQGFPVSVLPTQIFINADGTPYVPSKNVNIPFAVYNYNTTGEHAYTAHEGVLTKTQFLEILEDMGVSQ